MTLDSNRRAAFAFGIVLPGLQLCRSVCFGNLPATWLDVPIEMDAYVLGGLLVAGAWASARSASGRALLVAAWGFATGIMYRTTFEQLADPHRHAGAQGMVMAFKVLLLAAAIAGFVSAILSAREAARPQG